MRVPVSPLLSNSLCYQTFYHSHCLMVTALLMSEHLFQMIFSYWIVGATYILRKLVLCDICCRIYFLTLVRFINPFFLDEKIVPDFHFTLKPSSLQNYILKKLFSPFDLFFIFKSFIHVEFILVSYVSQGPQFIFFQVATYFFQSFTE